MSPYLNDNCDNHHCAQEARITALEVRMETALKALERGITRFEKFDVTIDEVKQSSLESSKELADRILKLQSFNDKMSGGYRLFLLLLTLLGSVIGISTYFSGRNSP